MSRALDDSFRPLDGESFSKRDEEHNERRENKRFRPLDGESFSKLIWVLNSLTPISLSFRPLDGESFSKLRFDLYETIDGLQVSVP